MVEISASKALAAVLLASGVLMTEVELYPDYGGDASYLVNAGFVFAVLLAGCALASLVLLFSGHDVAGGTTALLMGFLQATIFLASGNPAYYVPPLLETAAGLLILVAHGSGWPKARGPERVQFR